MPFSLFEFLKQIMIGAILITLAQFKNTESIGKVFIAQNLKLKFHFRNHSRFFCAISTVVFGEWYLRHFQHMNFN